MRTRLLASAGIAALLVAAPAAGRSEPSAKPKPRLVLVDSAPLTLRGTSFVRGERVHVLVKVQGRTKQRRLVATLRGSFSAVFPGVVLGHRCSWDLWAQATGMDGSRAVLKLPPQPLCPPTLRP
jgi:hypothetical protein